MAQLSTGEQVLPAVQLQAAPALCQAGQRSQLGGQGHVISSRLLPQLCARQQQLHARHGSLERRAAGQNCPTIPPLQRTCKRGAGKAHKGPDKRLEVPDAELGKGPLVALAWSSLLIRMDAMCVYTSHADLLAMWHFERVFGSAGTAVFA